MERAPARTSRSANELPSIYLPGFPKCGTTAIHNALVDAGAVTATVKEPSVLLLDGRTGADPIGSYRRYYPAGPTGPRIDASPYYIYDLRAIERMVRLGTASHVLVAVREPMSRIRSAYLDQFMQGMEKRSLAAALDEELRLGDGRPVTSAPRSFSRRYLDGSCYGPYVDRLLRSPLGPTVRLVALESFHDDAVRSDLGEWLGLEVPVPFGVHNTARTERSLAPALVDTVKRRAGELLPAAVHRRLAPVAKPLAARIAELPLRSSRQPDTCLPEALRRRIARRLDDGSCTLAAIADDRWLGGRAPAWVHTGLTGSVAETASDAAPTGLAVA